MITQKIKKINEVIVNLDFQFQLIYLYFVSKRQLKNYISFSKIENFGNPEIISNSINTIRKTIFQEIEIEYLEQLRGLIESASPDMEDFPSDLFASFALNTCSTIYECIEYIIDKDFERIEVITSISIRSIEAYIEKKYNIDENLDIEEIEKFVYEQDLMKNELKFQENLVNTLSFMSKVDVHFLELIEMIEDKTYEKLFSRPSYNQEIASMKK